MDEIPANIMAKALTYLGQPVYGADTLSSVAATYIARAILAERELCTAVAEAVAQDFGSSIMADGAWAVVEALKGRALVQGGKET